MSAILDSALDPDRRRACELNDAAMLAWAKKQAERSAAAHPLEPKAVSLDRCIAFTADTIEPVHSFDLVLAGIEAGAGRVEVFPLAPDVDALRRAGAL